MTKEKSTFLLKPISQALFIMLFAPTVFAASNFQIVPNGTLPTQVSAGGSVAANYTVTNMTSSTLTGYSVEGLPNTVTQNAGTGNCPSTINLNAKASCNLELDVTGETHSTFAVCKGSNCTQPSAPLNVSVVNASTQKFIYVTDNQGPPNTISLCQLGNNGEITTCQDAGAESVLSGIHPQGIVLNTDETRAYITSALSLTVYQCSINPTNHTFSLCVGTPITTPSRTVSGLGMITLNPNNTFVYLPANNGSNGSILACPVVNGVMSGTCSDTGATNIDINAAGVTLNKAGTQAYIANVGAGNVVVCNVNGATFSGCIVKVGGGSISFSEPTQVALNSTETIAYVTDGFSGDVYGCSTTSNNSPNFTNCFDTTNNAWGISINAANTIAYLTNYSSTVSQCTILNNGLFGTCTNGGTFNQAVSSALSY